MTTPSKRLPIAEHAAQDEGPICRKVERVPYRSTNKDSVGRGAI